jgi:hypothetical protein
MIMLLGAMLCIAQESYRIGVLPQVNLNLKLSDSWRMVIRAESRQILASGLFNDPFEFNYDHSLTDLALLATHRLGGTHNISLGYQMRLAGGKPIHRAIQQYSLVSVHNSFRLGHRFAADQTFEPDEPAEYRFRYRIGFEAALSGQSVDPGEFYFKVNQEQLNGFSDGDYDLELRLAPALGFEFTDNNKLEAGLDNRISSFLHGNLRSSFWLTIGWFITI